ncbi:MAG: beta-ketoacyl-ACP synthase III [Gammaproteobacteria bacterium]
MRYSKILGTGSYLPEKILTNQDLEKIVETTDEWITTRTGIKRRHVAGENESTADMAEVAARNALEMAGISADQLGMIVVGTSTGDDSFPSTASVLQHRLGCRHIPAFDVSAACSGFNYALSIADQYVKNNMCQHVLVIGVDLLSKIVDWSDRTTCVLFGDGAGAAVLSQSDEPGILSTHLFSDGSQRDMLFAENTSLQKNQNKSPYIKMQGKEVFRNAVERLGDMVQQTMEENNLTQSDLDWLVPHQANIRIINAIAKRIHLPMDKVVVTVDDQGNTSAASIPLALDIAVRDGRIQRGHLILLESFGGGLVWGSALVRF